MKGHLARGNSKTSTGKIVNYEIRPSKPRLDDKGKPRKYEKPRGSKACLDIPNLEKVRVSLRCDGPPLFITEGAKKADKAISEGLLHLEERKIR